MTAKEAILWIEIVSGSIAKMKRPDRPRVFLYDKPIPPRYAVWRQSRRVPKTL
jgi:hypothetical protein